MTRPDIAAIKERLRDATPGPWRFNTDEEWDDNDIFWLGWVEAGEGEKTEIIVRADSRWDDGKFIAHARQDIPALLAYIAELEALTPSPPPAPPEETP